MFDTNRYGPDVGKRNFCKSRWEGMQAMVIVHPFWHSTAKFYGMSNARWPVWHMPGAAFTH